MQRINNSIADLMTYLSAISSYDITSDAFMNFLANYRSGDNDDDQLASFTKLASFIAEQPCLLQFFDKHQTPFLAGKWGISGDHLPHVQSKISELICSDKKFVLNEGRADEYWMQKSVTPRAITYLVTTFPLSVGKQRPFGALVFFTAEPTRFSGAQVAHISLIGRQITAHLETKLENTQFNDTILKCNNLREVLDKSGEMFCITDTSGNILFVNDAVSTIFGYSKEEMLGAVVWDFCVPQERSRLFPALQENLSSANNRTCIETTVLTKSGIVRNMEWHLSNFHSQWLINGRDVTEKKNAQRHVEYLTACVKYSNAGLIIRDRKGAVLWMNPSAEKILGYSIDDLAGKVLGELLYGELSDKAKFDCARDSFNAGKDYEIETVIYRKDRVPVWVLISNAPSFKPDGSIDRQIGIIIDITKRKMAEENLIRTQQKALALNAEKESFISVMSHEVRTSLNAIIGVSRLLQENNPQPWQREHLDILSFSSDSLLQLINEVLDYSKAESGNIELKSKPFNITQLANSIIDSLRYRTAGKNVVLNCISDPSIPEVIVGDSTRIYQILMNILTNALKFTEHGSVQLELKRVHESKSSVEISFCCTDTGIGIEESKIDHIFKPYAQASSETAHRYGGTGLGLAIVKKLLQLHHATYKVESKLHEGMRFSFNIIFEKGLQGQACITEQTALFRLDARVLVVDDNSINLLMARRVMEKWGVQVDVAEDGMQAIQKINDNTYNVVFMDLNMPLLDGYTTAKTIRNMQGGKFRDLPVYALTSSGLYEEMERILSSGMNGRILKPFEPRALHDIIKKCCV